MIQQIQMTDTYKSGITFHKSFIKYKFLSPHFTSILSQLFRPHLILLFHALHYLYDLF